MKWLLLRFSGLKESCGRLIVCFKVEAETLCLLNFKIRLASLRWYLIWPAIRIQHSAILTVLAKVKKTKCREGKTNGGKPPKRPIERYEHTDKKRINNPPVGLVTPETDPVAPTHKSLRLHRARAIGEAAPGIGLRSAS